MAIPVLPHAWNAMVMAEKRSQQHIGPKCCVVRVADERTMKKTFHHTRGRKTCIHKPSHNINTYTHTNHVNV